ncbi:hypothetical protein HMPREF1705_04713 [Acetomicrobium hydrogeniformans ATCC BAA-1850]|uniref:Uncharacterized protein n=1 Tax=Acetomicrobium hydrogeniformans ATCC BAA-1850 TaxID=592015 RepID=A0A0T5X7X8_9BACT|nr:hypothetical protein HMPREF1705_04713 [Acetomicrobium hydrogeniformans ATCC BAA-1850]
MHFTYYFRALFFKKQFNIPFVLHNKKLMTMTCLKISPRTSTKKG